VGRLPARAWRGSRIWLKRRALRRLPFISCSARKAGSPQGDGELCHCGRSRFSDDNIIILVRSGRVTPGVRICLDLMEIINQSIKQPINQPINQSTDQSINQTIKQSNNQSINRSINQALGVGCLGGDNAAARRPGQKWPYIMLIVASRSISFVYSVGSNSDVYSWALGPWALGLGRWILGRWVFGRRQRGGEASRSKATIHHSDHRIELYNSRIVS